MPRTTELSDYGGHDFAEYFSDVPPRKVTKDLAGFLDGSWLYRLRKTNFVPDDLPIG